MQFYSVTSESWKAAVKNVVAILSFFYALFILPVPLCADVTLPPPSQPKTAFVRASNDKVYQIHYGGQGEFVDTFSVSLNGETLPRDVAAELYIAARILNGLPFQLTYDELKSWLDPIYENTADVQGWDRAATFIGSVSVSVLTTALTGGVSSVGDLGLKALEVLTPAVTATVTTTVSQETLLLRAYVITDSFFKSAANYGQVFDDLLKSASRGREISINEIKSTLQAKVQGDEYLQWGNRIMNEYVLLPGKLNRLWTFFKSLVPGFGQFFASQGQDWADYQKVLNIFNKSKQQIESNAAARVDPLFNAEAIAAARATLEREGFFQNEAPQPVGSIGVRPLMVGGSAATGDVSPYFSDPDNNRLTYSVQSDNTSVVTVNVSGSTVTVTPRSEGSANITITATDPGGLTATQTASVRVQAEQSCEYTLSQSSLDVPAAGGPVQVDVTTTSGCDWRATTSSDFLSVSPSSVTGSGTVSVTVEANTGTRSRTGTIRVAGETFRVRQDGKTTIASQDLSRRDAVIVQNTLNLGLNIRSGAGTNQPDIGTVFDGATGTVIGGPRSANGYKWWEVDWDNAPTGWSVEAIDEDLLILHRPPDLAIESFRVSDSTVDPGEEFTLSLTVRNKGYNESESATLHYYYSSTSEFAATDVVGVVGKDSVGRLDPDDTSKEQISATAPLTPGTYYYGVFLAGTQYIDDGSILNDDDPRNNFAPEKRVKVRKPTFPDLVVESPSVSEDTLAPGESFRLSATVRNRGSGESRSTTLRYYRSSNSNISASDIEVETDGVSSLDPDDTDDESATLNAPNEGGVYYYGACVDSVRNESDTDNNCSDGVRVTVRSPDLLVKNVQVSNNILIIEASFTLSATVRNQSTDSSDSTTLRYYRSSDSTISTDDTEVGTDSVSSLSGNATSDESTTLTAPSETGIYYYGACVDSVRSESWTGNNCSRAIPVAVRTSLNQAPDPVNTIPAQTLTVGDSAASVDVSGYFQDSDNDNLTYTATSDNTGVASVNVSGALVIITPASRGNVTIIVTASDGTLTATQDIAVTVEVATRVAHTLEKISGDNQQGVPGATLTSPFVVEVRDAANSGLQGIDVTFTVIAGGGSLSATRVTTDANGQASTTLTLGPNAGTNTVEASVSVIATSLRFTATVETVSNQAPEAVGTILPQTLTIAGSAAGVNVLANFRDPDNDSLTYTVTSNNTSVVTASVSGAVVTITPEGVGSATVTVTASDGTLNATQDFTVTVEAAPRSNRSPESVGSISIQTLRVGGSAASVDVSSNFRDPDNDRLTYTTTLDNTRVVTVSVSDATVTIRPQNTGRATITVTASDGTLTATQEIAVTVDAAPRVAQTLVKISGDNQQGPPGEALLSPFIVEVQDAENRGLEGVDITFTVTVGGGTLSETTVTTGANGQASSTLTLGYNEGENTVRVSAAGVSQTLIFNAVGANEINIPDRYLRAKIERALNKRSGDPITAAEMATLTRLNARESNISDLTGLKFAINLVELNLYDNDITILPTGVFEGFNKVTTLYLRRNPLVTIKAGAFNGMASLKELDLSAVRSSRGSLIGGGQLTTIEGGAFKGLPNLKSLSLHDNKIAVLGTGVFEGLSNATSLSLGRNPLVTIKADAFNGLASLKKLDLSAVRSSRGSLIGGSYLRTIEGRAFRGLSSLTELNLYDNNIEILRTGVFEGLSSVTVLYLRRNPLKTIKAGAFNGLANLKELNLSAVRSSRGSLIGGGQLTTVEGGAFKGMPNLEKLNLYDNKISALPTGVFEGLHSLTWLGLESNPGSPFTLVLELVRTDTTDHVAPGPATVVLQLAQGAPLEVTLDLSVEGGTLSATTATIERGKIQSDPFTLTQSGRAPAIVNMGAAPRVPRVYYGIRMAVGDSLSTGFILPHSMVKTSGDNQQGPTGATLEDPLIVEVRDATNRGLEGVDVKFAVTAGDGSLSDTTVMTDADGHAQSWLTLGSQPGTHTVQASVEGLAQTAVFNATIESMVFDFSVSAGTSFIHVPLKVTEVDGAAQTIESISDLYNALGGASTVNFLLTYDPATQGWLSYFGTFDTGRSADKVLTDDLGIIAGMQVPVTIRLRGNALGTNERSTITLNQGRNLVGLPLRDPRITRVSDLFSLEGIGGNVPVIILADNGEFKAVGQAGDPGDIPIVGGQAFILTVTAQKAVTVAISGEGWTNVSGTTAAPLMTGIEIGDTTPVLALKGSITSPVDGWGKMPHLRSGSGFRVIVKNLSTGRAVAAVTPPDEADYRLTVVDIKTGRAAQIGDILEISAQSPNPFIGVEPLQYTVTAEDVKRSLIELGDLVAYEIPAETELLRNYPNPFNPETWIPYRLAEEAVVTLTIYDGNGRVVRTLDVGHQVAAVYESRSKAIYWDGRNEVGEPVASGVFFYHLSAGDYSATRKMVILK